MYFFRVLSLSMCKESRDKLCYSNVHMFRPFYMYVLSSCILCSAEILIYILHSNRSSHFLLFIVDCNNSDNRKRGAAFPLFKIFLTFVSLTEIVFCLIMAFTDFLEAIYTSVLTRYSANANQKDISGEAIL